MTEIEISLESHLGAFYCVFLYRPTIYSYSYSTTYFL